MKLDLEYGAATVPVELPDSTEVFIPGETVPDPPFLTDPVAASREALAAPLGCSPIGEQVHAGSKVTIIFPDRVKGGEQPTAHRRVSIALVLEELSAAGVRDEDILLICSNGLHAKNTPAQLRGLLGSEIYHRFADRGQIMNHDSEDYDHLIDLGQTERGDAVLMNKYVYDADLAVLIGHTMGNPYGGYSGGYKHAATGISHWRSIATHHVPLVMHRPDFVPVSTHSLMRHKFDEIGASMEKSMGKPFFCVDAVLDSQARQLAVVAGRGDRIEQPTWEIADRRTYVKWAPAKYDVLVFGLPRAFQYGDGMGTNPIMILQAISAQLVRHKRVLNDNCVVIATAELGWFNEDLFTGQRELYERYSAGAQTFSDLAPLGELWANNPEFIRNYRYGFGFHPFHAFSMISSAQLADMHSSAIYVVGALDTGLARGMGMRTRGSVSDALADARKIVGDSPRILALPLAFKRSAVHLCLRDDDQIGLH